MRKRIYAWILALVALVSPLTASAVRAQVEVIPRPFVGPLSHPRYEEGGWYTALEFLFWHRDIPLKNQAVAVRGFRDIDGSITGTPGTFVGSNEVALATDQLRGPTNFAPGYNLTVGYRFQDGLAVQASWSHLTDIRMNASASVFPPNFNLGDQLENTVFFAPVTNFPNDFAGNPFNLNVGRPGATYGIWNAAAIMQIEFQQRFDMVDVIGRVPIMETDNYRSYGLFGPRAIVMWERFKWRTVDMGILGETSPSTNAVYSNVVSNRLYGLYVGSGNEYRLGDAPIGTFSFYWDLGGMLMADFIKGRAQYKLEDQTVTAKRNRNLWTLAPGFDTKIGFQWYIFEAITIRLGYNALALFNTGSSPRPVDFNFGNIDAGYSRNEFRWFHGLDFGVGLVW